MTSSDRSAAPLATADGGSDVRPFRVEVPQEDLDDLVARLHRTRWPDPSPAEPWAQGVPLDVLRGLCERWADGYDWRRAEQRLNAVPQFRTVLDGLDVHFLHVRSTSPDAIPLLLTHGWPDTVSGFLDVLGPLTEPDDPADAFHVVVPSLPGHGFSARPTSTGWDVERTAAAWATLMARLGYTRYGAHGGDWGSFVTGVLGHTDPEHLIGLHLTMPLAPAPDEDVELDERDRAAKERMIGYGQRRSAYAAVQSSRPQTLGYGLTDSPAGQLAWILERFHEWVDHEGDVTDVLPADHVLDIASTYWLTATATSSARLFWEAFSTTPMHPVSVPTGCSVTPHDAWMPRAWVERRFTDLRYWHDLPAGGHYPAVELPQTFAEEVRRFFRPLR